MYCPAHFEQNDASELQALVRAHPLATLVTAARGLSADLVPLVFDPAAGEHGTLRGHVARTNPLWQRRGEEALALFHGPDGYVSPGWYPTKREHGKAVPTWNYAVVEAHGRLVAIDDAPWLYAFLRDLTVAHEAGRPEPWDIGDAPLDYTEKMLKAIVGIELVLTQPLRGKWKLSQNQPAANRDGVVAGLEADGRPQAAAMVKRG